MLEKPIQNLKFGKMILGFWLEQKELLVHIEDQGNGFDYSTVPDPTAPENLEKINGRGIFLMERLSDEILYLENGRIVVLKFRI